MLINSANSWDNPIPNDLYIKGVPKRIYFNHASFGNTAATLTQLSAYSLKALGLPKDGDSVLLRFAGTFAGNANTKQIDINFGGASVNSTSFAQNAGGFTYEIELMRASDVLLTAAGIFVWNFASPTAGFVNSLYGSIAGQITVPDLDVNDSLIEIKGKGAGANDVLHLYTKIDLTR